MDRDVNLNCIAAWTCWLLAGIGSAADIVWGLPQIRLLGVMCVGAGATLHVRMFVQRLEQRERAAYNLGRQSVRSIR